MTASVHNNIFSNNYIGVAVRMPGGNMSGTSVQVYDNAITGSTRAAIYHAGSGTLSAACNWYGMPQPCTPGPPAVFVGPVDYSTFRINGTDNDVQTAGYQPVANSCVQPAVWTGNTSTAWHTAANWSGNALPDSLRYVTIPANPAGGRMPLLASGSTEIYALGVQAGALLTQTGGTLHCRGTNTISGTLIQSAGTYLTGCALAVSPGGALQQSGAGLIHLAHATGNAATADLTLAAGAAADQSGGTLQARDVVIAPIATYAQSGGLLQLLRDYSNSGSYSATGGTIAFTGTPLNPVFSGSNQFHHFLVAGGKSAGVPAGSSFSVSGNYTSATYGLPATATTTFNGTGSQSITGINSAAATFGNLVINNPDDGVTLLANANAAGNVTIAGGSFNLYLFTCNRTSSGGTLSAAAGTSLILGGAGGGQPGSNFPLHFATVSLDPASTVIYNGSNAVTQYIYGTTYGHLTLSNSYGTGTARKVTTGDITVKGELNINVGVHVKNEPSSQSTY
jgi:hypothetical protein